MEGPTQPPVFEHLDWTRPELADALEPVKSLLESEGWQAIERSVEDRLRYEQRMMMRPAPSGDDDETRAKYERIIGQWAGLRQVRAIAEGIVRAGEAAERELRDAA